MSLLARGTATAIATMVWVGKRGRETLTNHFPEIQ